MTFEELHLVYKNRVKEWIEKRSEWLHQSEPCSDHKNVPETVLDIIVEILMVRSKVFDKSTCGSFVQSFLNNDLAGVMHSADATNYQFLRTIYRAFYNIETYDLPKKYDAPVYE